MSLVFCENRKNFVKDFAASLNFVPPKIISKDMLSWA